MLENLTEVYNMEVYSVIKNDRPTDEIFWQFTGEDFNTNSQLIVQESEEALFVKDGIVVATFGPGRHNLTTANLPFIESIRKKFTGGVSPFSCKVYFIDKAAKLELKWGTDSPIQMRDAEFGFAVGVRARGSYTLQVEDSKKLYIKMIGNIPVFTVDVINDNFRSAFQQKIKNALANVMKEQKLTILDMNNELDNLSELIFPKIQEILSEYGLRLVNFYISDISIPENDPNYAQINQFYVDKASIKIQGNDYNRLKANELLKDIANNPGAGGVAAAGAGLGMGMASSGIFNNLAAQAFAPMQDQNIAPAPVQQPQARTSRFAPKKEEAPTSNATIKCPNCGSEVPENSKFCLECGTKMATEWQCKNCGEMVPANAKFCGNCGSRRED